jgi:hypothetical protein
MPESLVDPSSFANIAEIAGRLSSDLTSFFGFECRLGDPAPVADFLFSMSLDDARIILRGDDSIPREFQRYPAWQRVRSFISDWSDSEGPLSGKVLNAWLEFDIAEPRASVLAPRMFFGANPPAEDAAHSGESQRWIVQDAFPALTGRSLSLEREQTYRRCLSALPNGAFVFQAGAIFDDDRAPARLCIRNIETAAIPEYLKKIGWHGEEKPLSETLATFSQWADRIDLDIDVGEVVSPKIGLECYLIEPEDQKRRATDMLSHLVTSGLSTVEKKSGLLAFPGVCREKYAPEKWPARFGIPARVLAFRYESAFRRVIHHIKLVYENGASRQAKAYLGVFHFWLDVEWTKEIYHRLSAEREKISRQSSGR